MLTSLFKKVDQQKRIVLKWMPTDSLLVKVTKTIKYLEKVLVIDHPQSVAEQVTLALGKYAFISTKELTNDNALLDSFSSKTLWNTRLVSDKDEAIDYAVDLESRTQKGFVTLVPLAITGTNKRCAMTFTLKNKHKYDQSGFYYRRYPDLHLWGCKLTWGYAITELFKAMETEINTPILKLELELLKISIIKGIRCPDISKELTEFIEGFIVRVYGASLQIQYERDIAKQTRAKAWITKKQINKATKQAMASSSLNKHFSNLEFDNSVDLAKLPEFTKAINNLIGSLPKPKSQAELRLRKLGNYRALGMYVGGLYNTIVVDFRDNNDYADTPTLRGIGIQSFIHEYGHYLDYQLDRTSDDTSPAIPQLSNSSAFEKIYLRYVRELNLLSTKDYADSNQLEVEYILKHLDYYSTPTEVFARAWELYLSGLGLVSPLIKDSKVYETSPEYKAFAEVKSDIDNYFNALFVGLATKIKQLNLTAKTTKVAEESIPYNPKLNEVKVGDAFELVLDLWR